MSYAEMLAGDWRDIIEWHELAVKVLVNEPGIQGLLSSLPWADADGREKIMDKAIKQNVLLGEGSEPTKDHKPHTSDKDRKNMRLMRELSKSVLKGKEVQHHGL